MARKLKGAVVVITGASSGIGRATALAFARHRSRMVLAARDVHALREVAAECERLGGRARVVSMDVSDEAEVESLAREATEAFGRIDVWINNAAVAVFGRFEEMPAEDIRRLLEINLHGSIAGCRSALRRFREQGNGVLINVSAHEGETPLPWVSAYAASKAALNALSSSIRQELLLDEVDIHCCTVVPPTVDTPMFQHAANYSGRAVKPMGPVHRPSEVADAIVACARQPRAILKIGRPGTLVELERVLMPGRYERVSARQAKQEQFEDRPAPMDEGNLYRSDPALQEVSGGWREPRGPARQVVTGLLLLISTLALAVMGGGRQEA